MLKKSFILSSILSTALFSSNFYNSMSLQGMSGVINTPTAEVLEYEKMELGYSNEVDLDRFRYERDRYESDQYFVRFGLLPNLEVIGRLADINKKDKSSYTRWHNFFIRDLSASLKYQIPLYHQYMPKIAFGIQDIGGQADHYDAKYIVATKEYGFLRGSVGYGFSSINLLDGVFGSIELRATDFATLLSEYDSKDKQIGIRLNTPPSISQYVDLAFLAKVNLDDDSQKYSFGLSAKMMLGDDHDKVPLKTPIAQTQNCMVLPINTQATLNVNNGFDMHSLSKNLIDFGFENVDVGVLGDSIYVAYENNVLDHNELDAFGVVLGFIAKSGAPYQNFTLVMKKSDTKVKQLRGSLSAYKAFIALSNPTNMANFRKSLSLEAVDDSSVQLEYTGLNPSQFKTRIQLFPGLITFVGTELNDLDYLLSARAYASINLYKGFDLDILGDFPLFHSDELDRDNGAFKNYNQGNKLKSLLLHRSDVFGDFINIASAGIYGDFWAAMDSLTYAHENHTFSLKLDYLEERDVPDWKIDPDVRTNYLGIYSYYIPQIDANFRLTGGEFYSGDHGFEVRMKKFFGDTGVSFFYQNTDQNYIGINVALPLTPRRVGDYMVQLKGKNDFSYGLRTTVQDDDGRNTLETAYAVRIYNEFDTEKTFLNRNRLSTDYVKRHILRLKDAYLNFVADE
ncbi:MAG: hypothetical protein DSZ06_04050 [Sulfurospirillum sp.]|nr:MAG: hypothetical protein DSZ06_04050 [Sulfurospirillum sp.]